MDRIFVEIVSQVSPETLDEAVARVGQALLGRPATRQNALAAEAEVRSILLAAWQRGEISEPREPLALLLPKSGQMRIVDRPKTSREMLGLIEDLKRDVPEWEWSDVAECLANRVPELFPIVGGVPFATT
jgi:hypothetical protein